MDREARLREIKIESQKLYDEQRTIEEEIDRENAAALLAEGVLQQMEYEPTETASSFRVLGDVPLFYGYYRDTSFPCNLSITEEVGLWINFDDQFALLSSPSREALYKFAKEQGLTINVDSFSKRIEIAKEMIEQFQDIINYAEGDLT